jgi:hypothetical protein
MKVLPNPFYYLSNFHQVLDWISERYPDLLTEEEAAWITRFRAMPESSRALLVRFVMRKGILFRSSKLSYDEIGCINQAAKELVKAGWVDDQPLLNAEDLFGLLTKAELAEFLKEYIELPHNVKKADLLAILKEQFPESSRFSRFFPGSEECIYKLAEKTADFCDRLRLMFFGNLHQDWTEFVLADLGVFQYEKVQIDACSRSIQCRGDVDAYLHLQACRDRFHEGEPAEAVLAQLGAIPENPWLAVRRAKLIFQVARQHEQCGELDEALALYRKCSFPEARLRMIRVLEKTGQTAAAHELALAACLEPESDEEVQNLERIIPRLRRKLGLPKLPKVNLELVDESLLKLAHRDAAFSVEKAVCCHFHRGDAPVFYVENALINSLFGLLCWDAVFHPLPGAFFHPFHTGPADLNSPDFYRRRKTEFDACINLLESGHYKTVILERFEEKSGIQSPFVFWGAMNRALVEMALDCIPAAHLHHWFYRILQNIKENRTGFPDLIQFWPQEKRYRMIEVKGPGDRLQDNQIRLLAFARSHGMPVSVCYVEWEQAAA